MKTSLRGRVPGECKLEFELFNNGHIPPHRTDLVGKFLIGLKIDSSGKPCTSATSAWAHVVADRIRDTIGRNFMLRRADGLDRRLWMDISNTGLARPSYRRPSSKLVPRLVS